MNRSGSKKIAIVGAGHVGIAVGMGFVLLGNEVVFVDVNDDIIKKINASQPPIYEKGLEDLMRNNRGKYRAEKTLDRAIADTDVAFITVNTPSREDGSVDLSYLIEASVEIGKALRNVNRFYVVVVKSTVPPGTTENVVKPILEEYSGKKAFSDFGLAVNPEFLREGTAIKDFLTPDRIVIGVNDERSREILEELYSPIPAPKVIVDLKTAEIIKYVSNAFLATKISFANEIGNLCKRLGIDSWKVFEGVGLDRRIGQHLLKPGLGWGGPCLPKDVRALINIFRQNGEEPLILEAVYRVNKEQTYRLIKLLKKFIPDLKGRRIGVLGLTYKPGVDDVRETIAYDVIRILINEGARVIAHDPVGVEKFKATYPDISSSVEFAEAPEKVLEVAEAIVIVTDWPQYEELDYSGKIVVDGRRIKKAEKTAAHYEGIYW
ncbi:MAG: UDP-glucose/GDP-mannose dehydrogenase family protein [Desulfurococcaceae archaeon]